MTELRTPRSSSDHGFAMMITTLVSMIAAALIAALMVTVTSGLKQARQTGDSANALQVADAGVNAAIKKLTDYTGASPLTINETLGSTGDQYQVVATKEANGLWHVDSFGFDSHGQKRRVKATAVAGSLFSNAVFAKSTINFGSGVAVDSYSGGMTAAETCNGKGYVGTNEPASNDLDVSGGGFGVRNCTAEIPKYSDNPKGNVYDACVGYADTEPVPKFKNEAANATSRACGAIKYETPRIQIDNVDVAAIPLTANSLNCNSTLNLAPGKYRYNSITLRDGCRIPDATATQDNPVKIYTDGAVNIGSGANNVVNPPPAPPLNCAGTAATGNDYYNGTNASPLWYYCTGWPGRVQLYVAGGGTVNFAQHVTFWGVVYAPQRTMAGGPQSVLFGAFTANAIDSGAQITVHYDEALAAIKNGRYTINTWREEPLP